MITYRCTFVFTEEQSLKKIYPEGRQRKITLHIEEQKSERQRTSLQKLSKLEDNRA